MGNCLARKKDKKNKKNPKLLQPIKKPQEQKANPNNKKQFVNYKNLIQNLCSYYLARKYNKNNNLEGFIQRQNCDKICEESSDYDLIIQKKNESSLLYERVKQKGMFLDINFDIISNPVVKQKYMQLQKLELVTNNNINLPPVKFFQTDKIYKGTWDLNANKQGFGVMIYKDGSLFEGQFCNNKKTGYGRKIFNSGDVYEGNFVNGKFDGNGKFDTKDYQYEGQWSFGKKHGKGKEVYNDGSYFEGFYVDNKKHGQNCKWVYANGNKYEGEIIEDQIQGKGTYTWQDGTIYSGDWLNNLMHGQGRQQWPNGRVYEGQFYQQWQQGQGKMKLENGDMYIGQWVQNIMNGEITIITQNGLERKGIWENGQFQRWVSC